MGEDLGTAPRGPSAIAAAFESLLPAHKAELAIEHNPHLSNYETVESFEEWRKLDADDWVSAEQRDKAIATGQLWLCQWYPNTPVGFNILCACDLSALLAALASGPRGAAPNTTPTTKVDG